MTLSANPTPDEATLAAAKKARKRSPLMEAVAKFKEEMRLTGEIQKAQARFARKEAKLKEWLQQATNNLRSLREIHMQESQTRELALRSLRDARTTPSAS